MITDIVSSFPERSLENGQSGSLPVMIEIHNEATGTCSRPRLLGGRDLHMWACGPLLADIKIMSHYFMMWKQSTWWHIHECAVLATFGRLSSMTHKSGVRGSIAWLITTGTLAFVLPAGSINNHWAIAIVLPAGSIKDHQNASSMSWP